MYLNTAYAADYVYFNLVPIRWFNSYSLKTSTIYINVFKVPIKRKLSFSYLNELHKLLGLFIQSSFIY